MFYSWKLTFWRNRKLWYGSLSWQIFLRDVYTQKGLLVPDLQQISRKFGTVSDFFFTYPSSSLNPLYKKILYDIIILLQCEVCMCEISFLNNVFFLEFVIHHILTQKWIYLNSYWKKDQVYRAWSICLIYLCSALVCSLRSDTRRYQRYKNKLLNFIRYIYYIYNITGILH